MSAIVLFVEEKKAWHLLLAGVNGRKRNIQIATDGFVLPALNENPGLSLHIDGGGGLSHKQGFDEWEGQDWPPRVSRLFSWVHPD